MNVPGLSGTWKQRLAQYYKALTGKTYMGTRDEGIYMLGQIAKKNWAQPKSSGSKSSGSTNKTSGSNTSKSVALQYTDPITGQIQTASEIPQYENMLSQADAWGRLLPGATLAGENQIRPEAMRDYKSQYADYMKGMTNAGGERFLGARGQIGNIKAASERNYKNTLNNWLGQQQQGFNELFYNPQRDIWNQGRLQAKAGETYNPTDFTLPTTWEDYTAANPAYGQGQSTGFLYS